MSAWAAEPPPTPTETAKMEIRDVIHAHAGEVAACAAKKRGRVVTTFTIAPDGKVEKAAVKSSTIRDARVTRCVVKQIRSWVFPNVADAGPVVVGEFPFEFVE